MADLTANLIFLPWMRQGAAAALLAPDTFGAQQPGVAAAQAGLMINGSTPVSVPVRLMGPGHVTGLDPRQIIRSEPAPGSRAVEPNYFALVEFDEPSLPWLFTPAGAGAQARLRPWLVLVVVQKRDGVRLDPPGGGPLPVLRIGAPAKPAAELPDLADSWAWAHAQLTADSALPPDQWPALLATRPELSLARLVCPRLLQPETGYLACVVPAFELGRKAGLGQTILPADENQLAPAWVLAETLASVELPVYHHWEFTTGAGGDFESLALLLKARAVPPSVGQRAVDISASGLGLSIGAGTTLDFGGALQPVGTSVPAWPPAARQADFQAALANVLNVAGLATPGDDPVLAPPLYGGLQAKLRLLDPAQPARWFEQLNLDPGLRSAAQFGTRVIQDQQEALMASAWEQAGEIARLNQRLRHWQLGCFVSWSLHSRHLARMSPDEGLQFLAPAQARMVRSPLARTPSTGLEPQLQAIGLPPAAFSTALRRLARPRGAINRRLQKTTLSAVAPPRTGSMLRVLQPAVLMSRLVIPVTQRMSLESVAANLNPPRSDIGWNEASAAAVAAAARQPNFQFVPLGTPVPTIAPLPLKTPRGRAQPQAGAARSGAPKPLRPVDPDDPGRPFPPFPPEPPEPPEPPPPRPPRIDSADAAVFRAVAQAHLARFNPARPLPPPPQLFHGQLATLFSEALNRAAPGETFIARARALLQLPGPARADDAMLELLAYAPQFPQPMAEPLAEIGQDLILPGLDVVPPNTVLPLQTNTRFVESYLVGLNAEMAREMLWRGYPAPLSATFFDRFWDAGAALSSSPDIEPIADWGARAIGAGPGDAGGERFVMLVRSELLKRYPNALVYAMQPGTTPEVQRHPIFSGALQPDVRYFGFDLSVAAMRDWSIVIQEQPTAPRFGIDVGTDTGSATHLPASAANAAAMAQQTRQMPVRVVLPTSILLAQG